ncbi:MAG: 23S rRNA (adenine(2030)-N(6))-methyltransferase RlmJ [Parvularculaceae bacterium]
MNYRHAFHAGNFADVLKHAVLALCISYLKEKPAPFRVIDTHAGIGRYDLAGIEAGKTLEWIDGVGRLLGIDARFGARLTSRRFSSLISISCGK